MRRLIPLIAAALAIGAAVPSTAAVVDTKVNVDHQIVGSLVHQGASRFFVEASDYGVLAEVRRSGSRRFNFFNNRGALFGFVRRGTATRWDVYSTQHPEDRIGTVRKVDKRTWAAYVDDGDSVGEAVGPAALQGAASALLVFHD